MIKRTLVVGLVLAALLVFGVSTTFAQDLEPPAEEEAEPTSYSGQIIDVDLEAGTVTLLTEDGEEVVLNLGDGDYDHPIVALLSAYFGGASLEDYADAFDALQDVELENEDGDPVSGTVTDVTPITDAEGNVIGWEITLETEDGEVVVTSEDEDLATGLGDALDLLSDASFDAAEDDEGGLNVTGTVGDDIEAYHDDGIGFGVLVKLYAIAEESAEACEEEAGEEDAGGEAPAEEEDACAVTVEELVEMFTDGTGLGQIFKLYGKPSLLGVGHVRQALNSDGGSTSDGTADGGGDDGGGGGANGICNAREHGGNANATGQDVECP